MKRFRLFTLTLIAFLSVVLVYSTLVFAKSNEASPLQAAIEFRKTVGLDPAECANTHFVVSFDRTVTYCYHPRRIPPPPREEPYSVYLPLIFQSNAGELGNLPGHQMACDAHPPRANGNAGHGSEAKIV
jgi:hypothetical protein